MVKLFCFYVLFLSSIGEASEVHHRFSDVKKWSKIFDDPSREDWQKPKEIIALMQIKEGMKIADLGAGTGYFLPYLNSSVGERGKVLALDIEKSLIQHMNRRIEKENLNSVVAVQIDPQDPKLEKESLDRILTVDTWHHLGASPESRKNYGEKIWASLKPEGRFFIVDFDPELPDSIGPKKKHRIPLKQVISEASSSGFRCTPAKSSLKFQYVVECIK